MTPDEHAQVWVVKTLRRHGRTEAADDAEKRAPVPSPTVPRENKPRNPPRPLVPIPRENWPAWAKATAIFQKPDHVGIGDTVHYLTGKPGVYYKALRSWLAWPCGCDRRRDEWNVVYPFSQ